MMPAFCTQRPMPRARRYVVTAVPSRRGRKRLGRPAPSPGVIGISRMAKPAAPASTSSSVSNRKPPRLGTIASSTARG